MPLSIYTVGHSNHNIDDLLRMLRTMQLQQLIDVRAYPSSARYPQFAGAYLQQALAASGIDYHWAGSQLGGMRKARSTSPHYAIASSSLRAYADHMQTREFRTTITGLIDSARATRTVLMCSERDPSRCHRSLIADYLSSRGVHVVHLIDNGASRVHQLSPIARREGDCLIYDRGATRELDLER